MQPTEVIDPNNQEGRNRPEVVKQELEKVAKNVKENFISLAELLREVNDNRYHKDWGFNNFSDYVASIDMNPRKANWLVQISRTINRLGIPWEEVKTLGWRKTGVIARVLDATNYTYWINEARQESLPVLEEKVKAAKGGNEESETPIKMSLQFTEEENSIIETALEHAMQGDNVKTKGRAISIIAYDWLQMQTDGDE